MEDGRIRIIQHSAFLTVFNLFKYFLYNTDWILRISNGSSDH
jgi:hypothetical protein